MIRPDSSKELFELALRCRLLAAGFRAAGHDLMWVFFAIMLAPAASVGAPPAGPVRLQACVVVTKRCARESLHDRDFGDVVAEG